MLHSTLSNIEHHLGKETIDAFICCASYESRCLSIAKNLLLPKDAHAVIFVNRDFLSVAKDNLKSLEGIFERHHKSYEVYQLDTCNPLFTSDQIVKGFTDLLKTKDVRRFVIDVTSFTRESLLIMLKYFHYFKPEGVIVDLVYSNAKEYSVGDSVEKKWLSSGHKEVRSVLGYPGLLLPSKQNHLIVLVGFENDRALTLVHECEPAKITLGIPDETEWPTSPHQDTNIDRLLRLKNVVGKVNDFTFRGYDAKATKSSIQKIINQDHKYNTIIAPMNTKISTIGAAMVALEDENLQICYSQADAYNIANYSEPGDHFFCLRFLPG